MTDQHHHVRGCGSDNGALCFIGAAAAFGVANALTHWTLAIVAAIIVWFAIESVA